MSKNNNSVTSVNSYALALYELSEENNFVAAIEDQVNQIINLISKSEDFKLDNTLELNQDRIEPSFIESHEDKTIKGT